MNIKKDIEENKVALLVISNEGYNNILIDTIKKITGNDKICYVTLNKGHDALTIFLKKNKIKLNPIIIRLYMNTFFNSYFWSNLP